MSEIGMERMMMNVALHLPRNTYTTSMTTRNVIMMVSFRELILLMILSELSMTVAIWISEGSVGSMSFSSSNTPLMTFTVLEPVCFWMTIWAERLPLVTACCSFSS
ncbi:unknown [Bacteroides sp. CAG:770]|nr:unknown [Bacteroides sp. CAG:770]